MSDQQKFSLLATTKHIGWGGVGKLRLILEQIPCADVVLYEDEKITQLMNQFLGKEYKSRERAEKIDVGLVINDSRKAHHLAVNLKLPVVYVDSLPYVHKSEADVPAGVAYYCAQKYPAELFPRTSPLLQNRPQIKWIDPIVPRTQSRRGGGGVVVNLGGLYVYDVAGLPNDFTEKAVEAYLNLVLFPLVSFLQATGRKILAICGNLNAPACNRIRSSVPQSVMVGPQLPHAFERILSEADLLFTSPGSTTVLQAMSIDLPTLLLPPLNRSQFLNARIFSKPHADTLTWPASVLDGAKVEKMESHGLNEVLGYMFRSIIDAANSPAVTEEVEAMIRKGICSAPLGGVLNNCLRALGTAGAEQVAALVKEVAFRG